jgi:hypothetical protein
MVAGQSCIASPSVCLTLCYARLLSGASFFFRQIDSKKDSGKLVLREESVCRGLHGMSALTPYLKIVAIVCAISACTPVK